MSMGAEARQRTTLSLDRALVVAAQRELGTETITDTIEAALRSTLRRRPRVLFESGDPDLARNLDTYMAEGFGR